MSTARRLVSRLYLFGRILRTISLVCVAGSLIVFSYGLWSFWVPLILPMLGFSNIEVGLVLSLLLAMNASGGFLLGTIADVIGRGRALVLFTTLLVLSLVLAAWSLHIRSGLMFVIGVAASVLLVAAINVVFRVLVCEISQPDAREASLSVYYTATSLCGLVAPMVSGFLATISYDIVFTAAILVCSLAIPLLCLVQRMYTTSSRIESSESIRDIPSLLRALARCLVADRVLLMYFVGFALFCFATDVFIPLLPNYARYVAGLSKIEIGYLYSLASLMMMLGHALSGPVCKRLGLGKTLGIALGVDSLVLALLPFIGYGKMLLILWSIATLAFMLHEVPETLFIFNRVEPNLRATIMGAYNLCIALATLPGPTIGSIIWATLGLQILPLIAAIMTIPGTILVITATRRT